MWHYTVPSLNPFSDNVLPTPTDQPQSHSANDTTREKPLRTQVKNVQYGKLELMESTNDL